MYIAINFDSSNSNRLIESFTLAKMLNTKYDVSIENIDCQYINLIQEDHVTYDCIVVTDDPTCFGLLHELIHPLAEIIMKGYWEDEHEAGLSYDMYEREANDWLKNVFHNPNWYLGGDLSILTYNYLQLTFEDLQRMLLAQKLQK